MNHDNFINNIYLHHFSISTQLKVIFKAIIICLISLQYHKKDTHVEKDHSSLFKKITLILK